MSPAIRRVTTKLEAARTARREAEQSYRLNPTMATRQALRAAESEHRRVYRRYQGARYA